MEMGISFIVLFSMLLSFVYLGNRMYPRLQIERIYETSRLQVDNLRN